MNHGPIAKPIMDAPALSPATASLVLFEGIVAELHAGAEIVAVKVADAKAASLLLQGVALVFRVHGHAAVVVPQASQTPLGVDSLLGEASPSGRIVLLLADADALPGAMFEYLWQRIEQSRLPAARKLSVVVCGAPCPWAGLGEPRLAPMRSAILSSPLASPIPSLTRHRSFFANAATVAACCAAVALAVTAFGLQTPPRKVASVPPAVVARQVTAAVSPERPLVKAPAVGPPLVELSPAASSVAPDSMPEPAAGRPSPAVPLPIARPAPQPHGAPGLVLMAGAGDTMQTLYARIYRGTTPPPYAAVAAANRKPITPGSLVIFPDPPGGWPDRRHGTRP